MLFTGLSLGLKGKVDYAIRRRDNVLDSEASLWDRQYEKLLEQGVSKKDAIRVLGERPSIVFEEETKVKEAEEVKAETKAEEVKVVEAEIVEEVKAETKAEEVEVVEAEIVEETKEETKAEETKEETKAEETKEEAKAEETKEEAKAEETKEETKAEETKEETKRLNMVFDRIWGKLDNYILDDEAIKEITDKVMSVKNEIAKSNTRAKKVADSIVKEVIKNKNIFTLDETIKALTDDQYDVVKAVTLSVLEHLHGYYGISDKDRVILTEKELMCNYRKEVEECKYSASMGEEISQKIIKRKKLMSQQEIIDHYYEGCNISFMNEYILYMDALENEFEDYDPSNPRYFRIAVNRLLVDLRKIENK